MYEHSKIILLYSRSMRGVIQSSRTFGHPNARNSINYDQNFDRTEIFYCEILLQMRIVSETVRSKNLLRVAVALHLTGAEAAAQSS